MMDRRDDKIETIKEDTKDTLDEAKHRVQAGAEKVKRGVEGDSMPLGERVGSHLKEAGHNVKADYDQAKRDVRDGDA